MKIICLTEETVETLYLLGKEDLIAGVSQYAERPPEAKKHPVVSQFIRSDINKIVAIKPDLVIGFSDLQKDIAAELIGHGLNVFITNQRSIKEILENILMIGRIVGEEKKALLLINSFKKKLDFIQTQSTRFLRRPRVYFEEWDTPQYSCSQWISELIYICGGENIFQDKCGSLAVNRQVSVEEVRSLNPDMIFGCWCGKSVKLDSFKLRFPEVSAVKFQRVWELNPSIFLQPGPALFIDGISQMFEKIRDVAALDE